MKTCILYCIWPPSEYDQIRCIWAVGVIPKIVVSAPSAVNVLASAKPNTHTVTMLNRKNPWDEMVLHAGDAVQVKEEEEGEAQAVAAPVGAPQTGLSKIHEKSGARRRAPRAPLGTFVEIS